MRYTIDTVKAPAYATDGSKGYALTVAWSGEFRNPAAGVHVQTGRIAGWVDRTADGRVIATLDSYGWKYVTAEPVPDEVWSEQWVTDNAQAILSIYGWKV